MPDRHLRFIRPLLAPARSPSDVLVPTSARSVSPQRVEADRGLPELLPRNAGRFALRGCSSYHLQPPFDFHYGISRIRESLSAFSGAVGLIRGNWVQALVFLGIFGFAWVFATQEDRLFLRR
jgi:hypothetical protein